MKKIILVTLTLFLAVSINAQEKPKKTVKEAIEVAGLNKEEASKIKKIMKSRWQEIKAIKEKGLAKGAQWKEIKAVRDKYETKIVEAIGAEKGEVYNKYWRWNKKKKKQ